MFSSLKAAQELIGQAHFPGIDHLLRRLVYQSYAGNPTNNVTPNFIGELCLDTANSVWYQSVGTAAANWTKTSN